MCRAVMVARAGLLAFLLVIPRPVVSQDRDMVPAATLAELRQRFQDLDDRYQWARARADTRQAEETAERNELFRNRVDSVQVGPFRLIGRTADVAGDRSLVEARWRRFQEGLGGMEGLAFPAPDLLLSSGTSDPIRSLVQGTRYRPIFPEEWARVRPAQAPESDRVFSQIVLGLAFPDPVGRWATPSALYPEFEWDWAVRGILLSNSTRVDACLSGDNQVCLALLGLPGLDRSVIWDDPPAMEAFMEAARKRIRLLYPEPEWRALGERLPACNRSRAAETCLDAVAERFGLLVRPVDPAAHDGLLRTALEMGGPRAVTRVATLPKEASVVEVLQTLGDASLDEIVDRWRERILSHGSPGGGSPVGAGSALLWAAAFGLFSLTSSRWRA